jgi:hypothetical protein
MPDAPSAPSDSAAALAFIARWSHVGAAERANYALFLTELCAVLDVPPPTQPPTTPPTTPTSSSAPSRSTNATANPPSFVR